MVDDHGNELPAVTVQQINQKFDNGSARMAGIERELTATRKELHELKQQLADLLEFFSAMTGAIKVFNWVGKLARPATAIVAFVASCVTAWSAWRGLR
jgi:wobble nucleotide-excising tRNase